MEKRTRTEASQTQLQEETIQHIQSFLTGKEAARTTILSKSCYEAWLTRPNLDFSEGNFRSPRTQSVFVRFVEKSMQRYEELNRKIQSFRLQTDWHSSSISNYMAEEWILKAMKLGATDLYFETRHHHLPLEVSVLESKTLVRLTVVGGHICRHQKLNCSRLKFLRISNVCVEDNIIWDIMSMCTLIEELVLTGSYSSTLNSIFVLKPRLGAGEFHKLKMLSLTHVKIGEWFFHYMSSKFPCLKELTAHSCIVDEEIQICSSSLECISFIHHNVLRARFDVPRVRKFKFSGPVVPSLSFKTTSREWESEIYFGFGLKVDDSSWFLKLREFLQELSSSKIDLHLSIYLSKGYEYTNHVIGLPEPPIVEKLTFILYSPIFVVQSTLLEDLFRSCRPKFVTLPWGPDLVKNYDIVKLICNTLIEEEGEKLNTSDLVEVNAKVSGHAPWTWSRSLPSKTVDASTLSEWIETKVSLQPDTYRYLCICLQLRWSDNF